MEPEVELGAEFVDEALLGGEEQLPVGLVHQEGGVQEVVPGRLGDALLAGVRAQCLDDAGGQGVVAGQDFLGDEFAECQRQVRAAAAWP